MGIVLLASTNLEIYMLIWWCMLICLHSTLAQICFDPNLLSTITNNPIYKLNTLPFRIYQSRGLMDCYRHCGLHSLCQSVNFNTTTSECQLNQASNGAMMVNTGNIFMRIEPSSLEILKSCKNHGCPNNSICVMDGSSYRCVPVGCSGVPNTNHVNQSSFSFKPMWDFNEIVSFPCEAGYYPDTDAVCLTNGTWVNFFCLPIQGCRMLFNCGLPYGDGEYWVFSNILSSWIKLYCTDSHGRAFLTLHHPNLASTPSLLKNPRTCHTTVGDPKLYPEIGSTKFFKTRIRGSSTDITIDNYLYSQSNFTRQKFGSAGDCHSENTTNNACPAIGYFVVNTNGTGLRVKSSTTWVPMEAGGRIDNITRSADGLVIEGYCGADQGGCGGCQPESERIELELDPNYTPPDESAVWASCQHTPLP